MMEDCKPCDPGYKRLLSCENSNPVCLRCENGTFSSELNHDTQCSKCIKSCGRFEFIESPCSPTSNLKCACISGYFKRTDHDFQCEPHSRCPPGQGVSQRGTSRNDTQCKVCQPGTYSTVFSATHICQQHRSCADFGGVLHPGNATSDNTCRKTSTASETVRHQGVLLSVSVSVSAVLVLLAVIGALIYYFKYIRKQHSQNNLNVSNNNENETGSCLLSQCNIPGSVKTLNAEPAITDKEQCWLTDELKAEVESHSSSHTISSGGGSSYATLSADEEFLLSLSQVIPPNHPLLAQLPGALNQQELSLLDLSLSNRQAVIEHLKLWAQKNSNIDCAEVLKSAARLHGIIVPLQ